MPQQLRQTPLRRDPKARVHRLADRLEGGGEGFTGLLPPCPLAVSCTPNSFTYNSELRHFQPYDSRASEGGGGVGGGSFGCSHLIAKVFASVGCDTRIKQLNDAEQDDLVSGWVSHLEPTIDRRIHHRSDRLGCLISPKRC